MGYATTERRLPVSFTFDAGDLNRSLEEDIKRIAKEHQNRKERDLDAFRTRQKGRPVADIQRDYEAEFGSKLSDEDARLLSEGAPLN
jgi:hypothetical protein